MAWIEHRGALPVPSRRTRTLSLLDGDTIQPEGERLINRCVRLFDPCPSCATHEQVVFPSPLSTAVLRIPSIESFFPGSVPHL